MKKLLGIVVLGLLLSGNAYAKIDSSYEKQIYEGCINDAKRNNDFNSASKKFCKCYANQFDKKFNNEQLLKFLNKSQQEQAKIINNEISPSCYPKSKKKNKKSISILPSKLPVLECTFTILDIVREEKEITEMMDLDQINRKMIKQGYGKLNVTKDKYEFEYIQKFDTDEVYIEGYINRSTGYMKFTSSVSWDPWFTNSDGSRIIDGEKLYRDDVLGMVDFTHTGTCDKAERKNL